MNEAQLSEQQKQVETGETTTQTVPIVEQTTNESTQESNVTAANATANADQQAVSSAPKLTIEQQQAEELRLKYPIPPGGKPGGKGAFIQKMLHRSKKYFDSGDYNMAQCKNKQKLGINNPISMNTNTPTPPTTTPNNTQSTNQINTNNTSTAECVVLDQQQQPQLINKSIDNAARVSATVAAAPTSMSSPMSSPVVTSTSTFQHNNENILTTTPNILNIEQIKITTPTMYNSNNNSQNITPLATNNHLHQHLLNTTNNTSMNSPLSSSVSSNNLSTSNIHNNHQTQMPSSMSTQNILSLSLSTDRLSNIQLNPTVTKCILDSEEIGSDIPTPECLPQSRKHSIVQSKLATPRLSSS